MKRQYVGLSMLRASGVDRYRWWRAGQIETARCKACQFLATKSRQVTEQIEPCSGLAVEALDPFTTLTGRLHQPGDLRRSQGSTLLANVGFGVYSRQS